MTTRQSVKHRRKRRVRVCAAQLSAVISGQTFREKQRKTLEEILVMIREAGRARCDLILFGEYANLHHRTWSKKEEEYVPDPIPGALTAQVGIEARKAHVNVALPIFGNHRNVLSSYVVLFDRRGDIIGCYQKTHPTVAEQEIGIAPGKDLTVYAMDFGRVGIMTCMDIEYPEVAQVLMLRGADLLLFPHVQAGWGEEDWEIRYRSRAIDTGLPVVSATYGYKAGEWKPGKMIGRSGVIGRDGTVLTDRRHGVGIVACDLDLNAKRMTEFYFKGTVERTVAVTASRRPELYRDLVDIRLREKALKRVPKRIR